MLTEHMRHLSVTHGKLDNAISHLIRSRLHSSIFFLSLYRFRRVRGVALGSTDPSLSTFITHRKSNDSPLLTLMFQLRTFQPLHPVILSQTHRRTATNGIIQLFPTRCSPDQRAKRWETCRYHADGHLCCCPEAGRGAGFVGERGMEECCWVFVTKQEEAKVWSGEDAVLEGGRAGMLTVEGL